MSATLRHRGYTGSIRVSEEDECLYGQIEFINDLVTFEAATVSELKAAFAEAVDDYLATCAEAGRDPDKPFCGTFNVRVGPDLHREAAVAAFKEGTTLNHFVTAAIRQAVAGSSPAEQHFHTHNYITYHHGGVGEFEMPATIDEGLTLWKHEPLRAFSPC